MPFHLALPLAVTPAGRLAALEQDSRVEVGQSLGLLIATPPGDRRSVPDYGVPDPVFGGLSPDDIRAAAREFEDRADPMTIDDVSTSVREQHAVVYPQEG